MRTCPDCGAEVHEFADLGGTDHLVIAEAPMDLTTEPAEETPNAVRITATRRTALTTCRTLRELGLLP